MLSADENRAEEFRTSRARLADGGRESTLQAVENLARRIRLSDLDMIGRAGLGHIGGDFSVVDILATLYGAVLNIDPSRPRDPSGTASSSARATRRAPCTPPWLTAASSRSPSWRRSPSPCPR
jgi:hypothetical protein